MRMLRDDIKPGQRFAFSTRKAMSINVKSPLSHLIIQEEFLRLRGEEWRVE